MAVTKDGANSKKRIIVAEVLVSLGLFLLAFVPRAYALQHFVTADEAKWVYRSAQFLAAMLEGDFAGTNVNLTPAVTTTWLGSLGLAGYYTINQTMIDLPLIEWLLSLPEFRTALPILSATRWPMVIFTSLGVVVIYRLMRRLMDPILAFIGALFISLDPHMVALSRILGHDAPTAIFMFISILLLLLAIYAAENRDRPALSLIVLSGISAGFAFLSKAPALFLVPFIGLVFAGKVWGNNQKLFFWFKRFALWGGAAYLTFVLIWPAAWVDPLGRPLAVVENAFLSATDQEEADSEQHWFVPDLGYFYYLVHGAFKLSPLVTVGVGVAAARGILRSWQSFGSVQSRKEPEASDTLISPLLWLSVFVLLFMFFMTLGEKRSPRYILPIFPPLAVVAAFGWKILYQIAMKNYQSAADEDKTTDNLSEKNGEDKKIQSTSSFSFLGLYPGQAYASAIAFSAILALSAILILFPYQPYYFNYFNPLLGGGYMASRLVKIGWGEGLDQVGRYLQRALPHSRVGTPYASTVAPFFEGDLSTVVGSNLDYLVFYRKQVQSGEPSPTILRYFEQIEPIFSVEMNGIHYADVYPGPAVQPSLSLTPGLDAAILPKPVGFRPLTAYGRIGEALTVDVLWLAEEPLPSDPSSVTLRPLDTLIISHEGHDHGVVSTTQEKSKEHIILAEGEGVMKRIDDNLIVSRHILMMPASLTRGTYALLVDGRPLGELKLHRFQTPPDMRKAEGFVFDQHIALTGFQFTPADDYIDLTIAWQAQQAPLPDYVVFVQLLEAETNERVAGVDTQPLNGDLPTSRWLAGEVVVDNYRIEIPSDFSPGYYKVIVGLYRPETGERLLLNDRSDYWAVPWTFIRKDRNE